MSLPLPDNPTDVVSLADWVELQALAAADNNASLGDMDDALQLLLTQDNAAELTPQVSIELDRRLNSSKESYPFEFLSDSLLVAQEDLSDFMPYIFCLFLSYFGWKQEKGAKVNPWHLFEDLSCIAAREFTGGEVYKLGTSRSGNGDQSSSFEKAVSELADQLGEGIGFRPHGHLKPKDDKVDLIAWRDFEDRRESKFVIFGQCASGADWKSKVSELNPESFWSEWMLDGKISPLVRTFFVPHRIYEDESWKYYARKGGILFDRCRLSYYATKSLSDTKADDRYLAWCSDTLDVF